MTLRTPITSPDRVVIREGWGDAGKKGLLLCIVDIPDGQDWGVVIWDDEPDEPDLFKLRGLKIEKEADKK
jgi:hypothetical protein